MANLTTAEMDLIKDYLLQHPNLDQNIPTEDAALQELLKNAKEWDEPSAEAPEVQTPEPQQAPAEEAHPTLNLNEAEDNANNQNKNLDFTQEKTCWQEFCNKHNYGYSEVKEEAGYHFTAVREDKSVLDVHYTDYNNVAMSARNENGEKTTPRHHEFLNLLEQAKKRGVETITLGDIKTPEYTARLIIAAGEAGMKVTNLPNLDELKKQASLSPLESKALDLYAINRMDLMDRAKKIEQVRRKIKEDPNLDKERNELLALRKEKSEIFKTDPTNANTNPRVQEIKNRFAEIAKQRLSR